MKRRMNPNSLNNLIPNSRRTHAELSEMGRRGGIQSGITRSCYRVKMTLDCIDGNSYKVEGRTVEEAAAALEALEDMLYRSYHRREKAGKEEAGRSPKKRKTGKS